MTRAASPSDPASGTDPDEPSWVSRVLEFWFEELTAAQWFEKNDAVDAHIRALFLPLHRKLVACEGEVAATPRALLAAVIVFDQFSRNLFRGRPEAFASDRLAIELSRAAISRQFDRAMTEAQRLFLYMPFEHSENRDDQSRAVELIGALGNDSWTQDALAHQAIIDRFGRFPQRNAVLGRDSCAEELRLVDMLLRW